MGLRAVTRRAPDSKLRRVRARGVYLIGAVGSDTINSMMGCQ